MTYLRETTCIFCLHPTAATIGLDKRGKPFFRCVSCATRAFLPLPDLSMRGLALLPETLKVMREIMTEPRQRELIVTLMTELQRRARAGAAMPAPAPDAVLTAALEKIA